MSKVLMNPKDYSAEEIQSVLNRKLLKFGSKEAMPEATRELFERGEQELARRDGLR